MHSVRMVIVGVLFMMCGVVSTQNEAIDVCSGNEVQDIIEIFSGLSADLADVAMAGVGLEAAPEMVRQGVAYGEFARDYYATTYAALPECADGIIVRELAGMLYDQTTMSSLLLALLTYENDYGDVGFVLDLADLLTFRFESVENTRAQLTDVTVNTLIELDEVGFSTLSACTDDELEQAAALEEVEARYASLIPEITVYLQAGQPVSSQGVADAEAIALLPLQLAIPLCDPAYRLYFEAHRRYINTAILLFMAQLVDYETEYGDPETVDSLTVLIETYREVVAEQLDIDIDDPSA